MVYFRNCSTRNSNDSTLGQCIEVLKLLISPTRYLAQPYLWVVLGFALLVPRLTGAQSITGEAIVGPLPDLWPQVSLIEGKGPADQLGAQAPSGMPVPDPLQNQFDVLNYNLSVNIDPNFGWLAGSVEIIFQAQDQPVNRIVLDLLDQMNCYRMAIAYPYLANLAFVHNSDLLTARLATPRPRPIPSKPETSDMMITSARN